MAGVCAGNLEFCRFWRAVLENDMRQSMSRRAIVKRFQDAGLLIHPNVVSYIAESRNPAELIDDIIRVCPPCGFP